MLFYKIKTYWGKHILCPHSTNPYKMADWY